MAFRIRTSIGFGLLFITLLAGWKGYNYFFDVRVPVIQVTGIADGCWYSGDILGSLVSDKAVTVEVTIDGKVLAVNNGRLKRHRKYPLVIPSQTLKNGAHKLSVTLIDSQYHRNKTTDERVFFVDNMPLHVALMQEGNDTKVLQGRTLHVQFQSTKELAHAEVKVLGQTFPCHQESKNALIYECFIPVACEAAPNEHSCNILVADHVGNTCSLGHTFQIVMFPFKKQSLHVSAEKVQEEKEKGAGQSTLDELLVTLATQSPREKLWHGSFCLPMESPRITCEFGTVRTTQEKGRYIHRALDLANTPRSIVWATQDGVIAHIGRYASSGNTVVVDHGCGLLSLFYHLDTIADLNVTQKIAKGNPLGTVGKTGYATGYHLHWEMRIHNISVDPMQWVKDSF